jgi:predicted amidophosphoribosyltransferase
VNTAPQKELNDKERTKNTKNAFQVTHNIVKYKRVLLVDDIYTTGATLDACSDVLTIAGAVQVYFAAVCIGRGF